MTIAIVPSRTNFILNSPNWLCGVLVRGQNLLNFRNAYAHLTTPRDEKCLEDIRTCDRMLRQAIPAAVHFRGALWSRVDSKGRCFRFAGLQETDIEAPAFGASPGHACPFHAGSGRPQGCSKVRPVEGRSCSAALKSEDRNPKEGRNPNSENGLIRLAAAPPG